MVRRAWLILLLLLLLLAPALAAAQTYTIAPTPFQTALDNSGKIINGACVWTYVAGTTTQSTTYTTSTGTANSNPIQADSAGRFTAYLAPGSSYKFVYESKCTPPAHGTTLRTADGIGATPSSAASVDITGTAGESITAGQAVYLSDGSGGKNAGQWYKADSANAYSATSNWVGLATINIASAASGTIRLAGQVTGLNSLAVGSKYYVGSAGALTASAPANARLLGEADSATSLVLASNPVAVFPLTANATVLGGGAGAALTSVGPCTTGQLLVGVTSAAPACTTGEVAATARLANDQGITTNTTLADMTGVTLTVTAGQAYRFDLFIRAVTDTTGGLKWEMTGTATMTSFQGVILPVNNTSNSLATVATMTYSSAPSYAGGADYGIYATGSFVVNAGGTVKLQVAQSVSSGTSTFKAGSRLTVTPIN